MASARELRSRTRKSIIREKKAQARKPTSTRQIQQQVQEITQQTSKPQTELEKKAYSEAVKFIESKLRGKEGGFSYSSSSKFDRLKLKYVDEIRKANDSRIGKLIDIASVDRRRALGEFQKYRDELVAASQLKKEADIASGVREETTKDVYGPIPARQVGFDTEGKPVYETGLSKTRDRKGNPIYVAPSFRGGLSAGSQDTSKTAVGVKGQTSKNFNNVVRRELTNTAIQTLKNNVDFQNSNIGKSETNRIISRISNLVGGTSSKVSEKIEKIILGIKDKNGRSVFSLEQAKNIANPLKRFDKLVPSSSGGLLTLGGEKEPDTFIVIDEEPFTKSGRGTIITTQRRKDFFEILGINPNDKDAQELKKTSERLGRGLQVGLITENEANNEMEKALNDYQKKLIIKGLPKDIALGVGFAILSAVPIIGPIADVLLGADLILKRKSLAEQFKKYPLETGLQTGAFILGAKGATGGLRSIGIKGVKFGEEGLVLETGEISNFYKQLGDQAKKAGSSLKDFADFEANLIKDKRGSAFVEAAQILKKKKKSPLEKLSLDEALEAFNKSFRSKRIDIIELALRQELKNLKEGKLNTKSFNERVREFMRKSGLKKYEIDDILAEVFRRQAVKTLRFQKKNELISQKEFSQQIVKLNNLKSQLVKRLIDKKREEVIIKEIPKIKEPINQGQLLSEISKPKSMFSPLKQRDISRINTARQKQLERIKFNQKSLGERYKEAQKNRQSPGQREKARQREAQISRSEFGQKYAQRQLFLQPQKSKQLTLQKERTLQRERLLFNQKSIQVPLLKQKPTFGKPTRPVRDRRDKPFRPREKIPVKVPTKEEPKSKKGKIKKKVGMVKIRSYNVLGKPLKGKGFIKLNKVPLTKNQAKNLGAYLTDNSLARTFKLKPSSKDAMKPKLKIPSGYFKRTSRKFRNYRISKGKRIPLNKKWIEKRGKPLLDTRGEKQQITLRRKLAELERRSGFKKIPKKKIKSRKMIKKKVERRKR